MAGDDRRPDGDLSRDATLMRVEALLRALERRGGRFGAAGRPEAEPARLGQPPRLAFAAADVAAFRPGDARRPPKVSQNAVGLFGSEGPLPLHLTRWTLDRLAQRWHAAGGEGAVADTTFADFADMLQHRLIALHYRAWADNRPEAQAERPGGGRLGAMIDALAGLGLPGVADPYAPVRRRHAAGLAHQVASGERIGRFLADALGAPVAVVEFAPHWLDLPRAIQTRLGDANARLGRGATLGPRSFQRQSRIELRVGPLDAAGFAALQPGAPALASLRTGARHAIGVGLRVDLRLVVDRESAPRARLGAARLGRSAWLPGRGRGDLDDLAVPDFLAAAPVRGGGRAA